MIKKYLLLSLIALLFGGITAHAQGKITSNYAYCNCIEEFSYNKHIQDYYTSKYKCYKAWKKEMKRKKKQCQAMALEHDHPMAARRKRREAERKILKRDQLEQCYEECGDARDYWY